MTLVLMNCQWQCALARAAVFLDLNWSRSLQITFVILCYETAQRDSALWH
jgi:hypothetical protein